MQILTRLFNIVGIILLSQLVLTAQNDVEIMPNTNEQPNNTVIINGQNTEENIEKKQSKFDYGSQDILIPDSEGIDRMEDQPMGNFSKKKKKGSSFSTIQEQTVQDYMAKFDKTAAQKRTTPKKKPEAPRVYQTINPPNIIKKHKLIAPAISGAYPFDVEKIPAFDPETVEARLKGIPSFIRLDYNELVGKFVEMYVIHRRDQVTRMLARTDLYFPVFEAALDRYELPMELKYLPIIESALIPHAKASSGATGLWQLTYGTAKLYGLEANSFIDERRDPTLSTEAAVKHLHNLYKKYRDWYLVIAAYNCGEGTVNKAIRHSGGKTDYWEIAQFLPAQDRSYVPLFIAATYVMNYYPEHNLYKYDASYSLYATDTVRVKHTLDLKQLAGYLSMPIEELQFLNPAIKRNIIPRSRRGYPFNLPLSKISLFEMYIGNIEAKNREIIIDKNKIADTDLPSDNIWNYEMNEFDIEYMPIKVINDETVALEYTVRAGDDLSKIAKMYDCETKELKRWNGLRNNRIDVGEILVVKVPEAHRKAFENIEARNLAEPEEIEKEIEELIDDAKRNSENTSKEKTKVDNNAKAKIKTPKEPIISDGDHSGINYNKDIPVVETEPLNVERQEHILHIVKKGENLYNIALKYGSTPEELRYINDLESNYLKVGMQLVIPKK
ncbi:MAG: transglycosylase SLT domain-containing protein [Chitinophagales bacterium]